MVQLVPEQRADKNGKLVTRHVSASTGGPSAGQNRVPRPSTGPDPKRLAREAMVRLKANDIDVMRGSYGNSALYYLASISPDLMESVVSAAVASNKNESRAWYYYLADLPVPDKGTPRWHKLWHKYQHLAERIPTASYLEETSPHAQYRNQAVNLLSLVDHAYPDKHDDSDFMRAASIVMHINGENKPLKMLSNTHDYHKYISEIELIAEHIEDMEKVIPILRKRESTSLGVVTALLESGSVSLAEGML